MIDNKIYENITNVRKNKDPNLDIIKIMNEKFENIERFLSISLLFNVEPIVNMTYTYNTSVNLIDYNETEKSFDYYVKYKMNFNELNKIADTLDDKRVLKVYEDFRDTIFIDNNDTSLSSCDYINYLSIVSRIKGYKVFKIKLNSISNDIEISFMITDKGDNKL